MDVQNIILQSHKGFGYLVLILVFCFWVALLLTMFGYSGRITKYFRKITLITMISFHVQLLIGIVMLIFSPGFKNAMSAGTLMSDAYSRMTYVEHPVSMLIAAILMTIINKYVKVNEKLSLKITLMGLVAITLFAFAFPWRRAFGLDYF